MLVTLRVMRRRSIGSVPQMRFVVVRIRDASADRAVEEHG
jgi:hypothetical protein